MKTYSTAPRGERRREVPCNLCGGRSARPFMEGENFRFVRCRACTLVYQNPQPVFDDLKQRYGKAYFRYELENEQNFFNLMRLGLEDVRFFQLSARTLQKIRFLDIGCATGMLLSYLREHGFSVQGVELCRQSAEHGRRNRKLDIYVGTLEEATFPDSHFDVIHFSHLLEHVPDPRRFLAEVHRILAPEGYVVVVTPNIAGLQARLFRAGWRSAIPDHLTLFSKSTLARMLELSGFEVLRTVTWGGLARGTVPGIIKKPADYLAKKAGFGDVMLMLNRKAG